MKTTHNCFRVLVNLCVVGAIALGIAGCSGEDGAPGAPGATVGVAALADATELNFTITRVSTASRPVVEFSVTNQDGVPVAGFAETDLRFNISKLVATTPTKWQNYINRVSSNGAVQATQERSRTGYSWGTLVDNKNGTFSYTFATDLATVTCPAPCTDADGNTLDVSYQPTLTHRITIQQGNSALPLANVIHDYVPGGGTVSTTREIVSTAKCNECHNKISAHGGTRIDTKLCVSCHNPGSWDNSPGNVQTVDFSVFVHKLHHGDELPSVLDPDGNPATTTKGTYSIGTHIFSDVAFPQDIRNCTKCHDGTGYGTPSAVSNATANGDNWKTMPSKAACSSCHDDVYFGVTATKAYQVVSHMTLITNAGGVAVADPADSTCTQCHNATGGIAGSIGDKHAYPVLMKEEGAKYQFNIIDICGTPVGSNPQCVVGAVPTIKFSVTNPATGTPYDIQGDATFKCVNGTGLPASMSVLIGWNNTDENNTGSNSNPGQPWTASVLETYSGGVCSANANVTALGSNIFLMTLNGKTVPAAATGSGRASLYGRINKDVDGNGTKENVRIKAAYRDFRITDVTATARRQVVDIAKCDKCHDQLSLHGDSRTDEPGLCVMCHNPSATDVNRRPKTGGIPDSTLTLDSKKEESIDFKRMVHSIHAAAKTTYTGATAHGFRNKGVVIYGYNSSVNDFSHVRFPGILSDCTTCHLTGTYELTGKWEIPTTSGVLGSSINTAPSAVDAATLTTGLADQADDLNITPTAAVCSSCHDSDVAKSHMTLNGALFAATQATINTGTVLEACAICHGPGKLADVKVIHGVK